MAESGGDDVASRAREGEARAGIGQGHRRDSLADLYVRNLPAAIGLAYLITGDRTVAEDLAQDAFVRLAGRFRHLRSPEAFPAYLRRTVVNLCLSHLRHARVERTYLRTQSSRPPAAAGLDLETRDEVWQAVRRLTARQRAAVVLRLYEDLSEREAAEALGVSVPAVRSQLARAMEALRRQLGKGE
jgi:RNA polymerase sigma-70 factor (sigma-E family)